MIPFGYLPSWQPKPAADQVYMAVEIPGGHFGFPWVGDGSGIRSRVKARGQTLRNLSITTHVCKNVLLADVPAIIGSIDVVMGEVDR